MPLVKASVEQLEAAQRLYEAATLCINSVYQHSLEEEVAVVPMSKFSELIIAASKCKEEFEKHGS